MANRWDFGIQEDFDNMTKDLGRECIVYPRLVDLSYEGQEDTSSGMDTGVTEVVFVQELDSEHEMIASGQMDVADVRFVFLSNSTAEIEGFVTADEGVSYYKILTLTIVKNQQNNVIEYIKGMGKKIPNR